MQGKVIVITGATSGIGQVAAEQLAGMGARLVLVARSEVRGRAVLARLRERAPGVLHSIHYADLSRIVEIKRAATEIAAAEKRIDILINNAGALFASRRVTEDGLNVPFATNHMAYVVLTHGLRERLIASAPARVVNTASNAHKGARLDFDDLQSAHGYRGFKVYRRSKLCNILYTRSSRVAGPARVSPSTASIQDSSPLALRIRVAAVLPHRPHGEDVSPSRPRKERDDRVPCFFTRRWLMSVVATSTNAARSRLRRSTG
jgi:NAD(P)-dependent dehydrogenase (short-subunit alcohol dehydrogenase family)